jgi:hypothetical protein
MKITTPLVSVKDQLIHFLAQGYSLMGYCLNGRTREEIYPDAEQWTRRVMEYFQATFPTFKEGGQFLNGSFISTTRSGMDAVVNDILNTLNFRVGVLETVLANMETIYEFRPETARLYIQDIDSFAKVRDINHQQIEHLLHDGAIDIPEKDVKAALTGIVGELFLAKDWGGETEDIYTSRVLFSGNRTQTSMLLKGGGTINGRVTHLADLGRNGDQISRMVKSTTTTLFIVQSVKPIAQEIIHTLDAHIAQLRTQGQHSYYCVVDGQDTAMLLYAYGYRS